MGSWWVEIVFLAMLAGFIALRLVSVLGRRTGHERPVGDLYRASSPDVTPAGAPLPDARARASVEMPDDVSPEVRRGLAAIAEADPGFDPQRFVEGAKGAYRIILEAFWKSDLAAFEGLVSDDVSDQFRRAIALRESEGHTLDNRLIDIDRATVVDAQLHGSMAEVTMRFDASIAAVTRDRDGRVVAGSTSDAVEAHDEWTFRRHVTASDPNWLLVATEGAE